MRDIPYYLVKKLSSINIYSMDDIITIGYLNIFAHLRLIEPSIGYHILFDLYSLANNISYPSDEQKKILVKEYKLYPRQYLPLDSEVIKKYINEAKYEAENALSIDEIPIGAIIVYQDKIIGRGYNQTKTKNDILAHAEMIAISQAQSYLGNHRLNECDLYVTIEPCLMCSGAIINSRIKRVIYGASEPKTGACLSQYMVFQNKQVNHHCQVIDNVDVSCADILKLFFKNKC